MNNSNSQENHNFFLDSLLLKCSPTLPLQLTLLSEKKTLNLIKNKIFCMNFVTLCQKINKDQGNLFETITSLFLKDI